MGCKRKKDDCAEVDAVTGALSQLPPPSQEPLALPTYRIKETTKEINLSVICKLPRICRLPLLVEEIKEEDDEVPELEQMFFYRCCTATLGNIEKRDRGSTESKYPAFHKTCLRYWVGRERESASAPEKDDDGIPTGKR
ncbi:hypothetical protein BBJ29_004050 [Phytophthora kernoviae]|uniref:Uncharacterized protein n=1 Tax=Phytophthora kernoviae TaxID=325452 RepID=A0A3F2RW16_9STRA|nr:hypothetical protein BBJ29_004050 [Phytophthora kernoviae]RLN64486.1 hypothetical protein BBP00_00003435 [Phytophthora kernoviae]